MPVAPGTPSVTDDAFVEVELSLVDEFPPIDGGTSNDREHQPMAARRTPNDIHPREQLLGRPDRAVVVHA